MFKISIDFTRINKCVDHQGTTFENEQLDQVNSSMIR